VRWGCGNPCGPSYGYGYGAGYRYGSGYGYGYGAGYVDRPVHVAYQGPVYEPPVTGYTYPVYRVRRPLVRGYGYRHLYRPAARVAYRGVYAPRRIYGPRVYGPRVYGPRRPAWWGK
jgi:hypothetical protein